MSSKERFSNVMVDLETMATGHDAIVLSIGLCTFGPDTRGVWTIGEGAYVVLNDSDQAGHGRQISNDTMAWWDKQSEEARKVLQHSKDAPGNANAGALLSLMEFFPPKCTVWGNGSDFDNVILRSLYGTYGLDCPWSHGKNRCFRTLKALGTMMGVGKLPERQGTHHNAYDDAVTQAQAACAILNSLTGAIDDGR